MVRHGQVEQKNVGLDLGRQFHRLEAVAGFAHHFHIAFRFQQAPQSVAENRVIVGNHNAYGMSCVYPCLAIDWLSLDADRLAFSIALSEFAYP